MPVGERSAPRGIPSSQLQQARRNGAPALGPPWPRAIANSRREVERRKAGEAAVKRGKEPLSSALRAVADHAEETAASYPTDSYPPRRTSGARSAANCIDEVVQMLRWVSNVGTGGLGQVRRRPASGRPRENRQRPAARGKIGDRLVHRLCARTPPRGARRSRAHSGAAGLHENCRGEGKIKNSPNRLCRSRSAGQQPADRVLTAWRRRRSPTSRAHAQASAVDMNITAIAGAIRMEVHDDGKSSPRAGKSSPPRPTDVSAWWA